MDCVTYGSKPPQPWPGRDRFGFYTKPDHFVMVSPDQAYNLGHSDARANVAITVGWIIFTSLLIWACYCVVRSVYRFFRDDLAKAFARATEDESKHRGWTTDRAYRLPSSPPPPSGGGE